MPSLGARGPRRLDHVVWSAWISTAALLAIVLGLGIIVDQLHDRADVQRQAQAVTSELEADAAELEAAEDAWIGEQGIGVRMEARAELAELNTKMTVLENLSNESVVPKIERDLRTLEAALRVQLAHLEAGDFEAAEEVDRQRTDPAFEAFDTRLEAAHVYYATSAKGAREMSQAGLWLAMLIAGVSISGLAWRQERGRIARQKALEQRLRERAAEVAAISERHRQLEAMKYSFIAAVSHELRTPLTAILLALEMLEDDDEEPLPPDVSKVVSVAARGTRRLSRLVEEIVDLERLTSGHFSLDLAPQDLEALLLQTVESLTPLAEQAGVELVLHGVHANVLCDGDRVLQALINLVGNAIKFTPAGGSIYLETVRRDTEVEVRVRDEGRGIPDEQLGAVFDRFHQVDAKIDQAKGGAGIGLTLTRQLIEAQGGRIWVESKQGTGTTFRFTLPLAPSESHDQEALPELRVPCDKDDPH